jgi:hypothetical protein
MRAASPRRFWTRNTAASSKVRKNLALALVAFELAWVDAGAATSSLAGNLGLAPIHERGTPEQRATTCCWRRAASNLGETANRFARRLR